MMRIAFLYGVLICIPNAWGQSVLTAAGGQGSGADVNVAWTIGEPIITTGSAGNVMVTQGFHQPPVDFNTVVLLRVEKPATWQLYPNPTRSTLQFFTTEPDAYQAEVMNAVGQRTHLWPISASQGLWTVEDLACGAYHLRVLDRSGNELHTLEFIVSQ